MPADATTSASRRRCLGALATAVAGVLATTPVAALSGDDGDDEDAESTDQRRDARLSPEPCSQAEASAEVGYQTVCDLNGDGYYRDLDASGDVTSQDLSEFFANQHRDPWDSRDDLFDFDDDGTVGQPDVVAFFEYLVDL